MRHPSAVSSRRRRARALAVTTTVSVPLQAATGLMLLSFAAVLLAHFS